MRAPGQPGLHRETLPQKTTQELIAGGTMVFLVFAARANYTQVVVVVVGAGRQAMVVNVSENKGCKPMTELLDILILTASTPH